MTGASTSSTAWSVCSPTTRMLGAPRYQDFGKPPFEQLFEITVPSGVIKYYRENLRELIPQLG
jgi:hypothetical protein